MWAGRTRRWLQGLRSCGPYIVIEMLLPGGTLLAFLLWLCERASAAGLGMPRRVAPPLRHAPAAVAGPHALEPDPQPEPAIDALVA